jgi:hypothetical protein
MTMNDLGWIGRRRAIPMVDELSRAGFVETAALLSMECGVEIQFLGRHLSDRGGTLMLEANGKHLSYRLLSDGGWLHLFVCEQDRATWQNLLVTGDTVPGREKMRAVLVILEAEEVRDPSTFDADLLRNH